MSSPLIRTPPDQSNPTPKLAIYDGDSTKEFGGHHHSVHSEWEMSPRHGLAPRNLGPGRDWKGRRSLEPAFPRNMPTQWRTGPKLAETRASPVVCWVRHCGPCLVLLGTGLWPNLPQINHTWNSLMPTRVKVSTCLWNGTLPHAKHCSRF